jgi:hypothetical protein
MWMLGLTIASFPIWMLTGFNLQEGDVPVLGIQWSTFGTFALFFYLLTVNLQVGGLNSFRQLRAEVRYDLHFLPRFPMDLIKRRRPDYKTAGVVDPLRAFAVALLICVSCLFLFESIWVPLYDYLQFGSVMWPVYSANTGLFTVFERNTFFFIAPLLGGTVFFWTVIDDEFIMMPNFSVVKTYWHRYSMSFRLDRYWVLILGLTAAMWGLWIWFPHSAMNLGSLTSAQVSGELAKSFSLSNCYIFPSQGLFPQNTYTFYPCSAAGQPYPLKDIMAFFSPGNWLHLVNVLTKYATFLSVCYPAMIRVKVNK